MSIALKPEELVINPRNLVANENITDKHSFADLLCRNTNEPQIHFSFTSARKEVNKKDSFLRTSITIGKILSLLLCLYCFICSLSLMGKAFRLLTGKITVSIFAGVALLQNPIVGVMIGVLATILLQSSSTTSSILVSMVASGVVTVKEGIPIVMGCNIGTSITSTLVALSQMDDREAFQRSFAAATVHDMFNWCNTIVCLILEVSIGYLNAITGKIVGSIDYSSQNTSENKMLGIITDPLVDLIIQIDGKVLKSWSMNVNASSNHELAKYANRTTMIRRECKECIFLFKSTNLEDRYVGLILLIASLILLCVCLILMVKLLRSMLKGHVVVVISKVVNTDIPFCPWLTGYIAIAVGCVLTFIVQSSSVFTSTLTPLAGIGVISIRRIYPLILGSNLGTTTTAILASVASSRSHFKFSLQISLCHFFFNLTGILLFYVVPFTRIPIDLAVILGKTTSKHRWFAILYLIFMFVFLPGFVLTLSLGGNVLLLSVLIPIVSIILIIIVINVIQRKKKELLPQKLQSWDFLPLWAHSLTPLEEVLITFFCCSKRTCGKCVKDSESKNYEGHVNYVADQTDSRL